jgi:uncharacterized integral membrane protein
MERLEHWAHLLTAPLRTLWAGFADVFPNLLAAALILALGYVVARVVRGLLRRMLAVIGIDALGESVALNTFLARANIQAPLSAIIATFVFWLLILVFAISATDSVGLPRLSATLDTFLLYLPRVFGALFILVLGLFVAGFVRDLVRGAAAGVGIDYAGALGSAAYVMLLVIVVTLAIGQLDLETQLLNHVIAITVLSAGVATALAFGLGAREVAANILAGTYVRELYAAGDRVRYLDVEGEIRFIGAAKTVISHERGDISVANADMLRNIVARLPG